MEDFNECAICYEDKPLIRISGNCCHVFCENCIKLNRSDKCPYCRKHIAHFHHCVDCGVYSMTNNILRYPRFGDAKKLTYCLFCIKKYIKTKCNTYTYVYNYIFCRYESKILVRTNNGEFFIDNISKNELKDIELYISSDNTYEISYTANLFNDETKKKLNLYLLKRNRYLAVKNDWISYNRRDDNKLNILLLKRKHYLICNKKSLLKLVSDKNPDLLQELYRQFNLSL